MSVTTFTLDPQDFAAFRAGDESALEHLFRDRYPALVTSAGAELDNPAHAARAVEQAALQVWRSRADIGTPESLESFFAQALHDAIAHERLRAASARRFESFERVSGNGHHTAAAPAVDDAWEKVRLTLHPSVTSPDMRSAAKHLAAQHMAQIGRRRSRLMPALGVLVAATFGFFLFYWLPRQRANAEVLRAFASGNARNISTENGQRGSVTLVDGSNVTLGSGSQVTIPPGFNTRYRAVKLVGTAAFTVAGGKSLPFVVFTDDVTITATGTAFDVSAFPADRTVLLRVRDGSVTVRTPKANRDVRAGEAVLVKSPRSFETPPMAALDDGFSWLNGQFMVTDRPLRETLPLLQRWYALNFKDGDSPLLDRRVSLRVGLDSARAALMELQVRASVTVAYEGNKIVLHDGPPPATKR
jgi:ferric-dicitrate binding protein FerR (iron transport regulator)